MDRDWNEVEITVGANNLAMEFAFPLNCLWGSDVLFERLNVEARAEAKLKGAALRQAVQAELAQPVEPGAPLWRALRW